ncbi:MAG: type IV pilus assembly protein FimV, partial [Rubrivivax sp.]
MLAFSTAAHPLSLGRMSVLSALGEPLRAEIDVTSLTAEQTASLQVGLAPAEVYRAAGMDYSELLRGTQVVLTRRADGRSVLQVSSDRAARDPFVDLILQATWANGRLVREYTVLLDPPRPDAPGLADPRLPPPSSAVADLAPPPSPQVAAAPAPAPTRPPAPPVATAPNRPEPARSVVATPAPPVPARPPAEDAAGAVARAPEASPGRIASTREAAAERSGDRTVRT